MKRVVHAEGEVEYGTDCAPLWMRGSVQDITMQKSRENDIKSYAFQQECLADLCRYLLSEGTISTIVNETSDVIVKAFGAEYSAIFKLLPDGKTLLLAGGVGWRERITGIATVDSSQPDCCLLSDNPIVIKDLKTDMRLTGVKIFSEHSIISGISVIVKVKNRPYGVLGVYVTKQRAFSDSEVDCLQTISNVLALSIERKIAEDSTRELAETLEQRVRERTREQVEAYNKLQVEILESKRKEEELYKSEGKYRLLVESLPQGIFYKDRNLVYVSCNENYARILSLKPEEIPGKTDYDLYPKELADTYARDDAKIIESGNMMDVEEKYIKDERELFIHTVKVPVRDKKGSIVGILGNYSDITEKVMLRMESVRLRQLVSIGELAAGVAHEINNPINSIINYAQILINSASDTDTGREKDIATRILKEGDRIAKIVGSLLSFARKSGKEDMRLVHIQEILSEAVILTGAQLRKDGIKTKVAISPVLSQIQVNVQQILQVFMNIISNARYALNEKYREKHDNKILEIIVGEMTTDGKAFVRTLFLDHGTGIPKDIMDKVMNPFFTTKPRSKGTGLGLSISQGIINDHGGKLKIESIEGEFTKVTVILPAVKE
jgi:PAS domain S-box-containing protein